MRFTPAGSRVIELILMAALAAGTGLPAFSAEVHQFDIPEEAAPAAIRDFGTQAHVQILAAGENVKDKRLNAVSGAFTTEDGLNVLLAGSGLGHKYVGDHSIALVTASSSNSAPTQPAVQEEAGSSKSSSGDSLRLAQATSGQASSAVSVTGGGSGSQENSKQPYIQEVVVTAQKRSERLLDVPVPVTVVDTQSLANSGAGRIEDYFATVPGMSLLGSISGGGTQYIVLRGLSTSAGSGPTVATVIDDVPFGASTAVNLGQFSYPDIDPSDLARIEVLKGPQGTLYGADSLGGLIKVVTQDPSTSGFSGHFQVLSEDIPDGNVGYAVRGSVNIPVSDTFAVRASAFARKDPGYIDNVYTGQDNVNDVGAYGARVSALWRPSEAVSLKLAALFQNTQGFGLSQINANQTLQPTIGDRRQTNWPGSGRYDVQVQQYSATLNVKVAGVTVTSVSGYGIDKWSNFSDWNAYTSGDITPYLPQIAPQFTGVASDVFSQYSDVNKISEELRLSAPLGPHLDWLVGGFFTHEHSLLAQDENPAAATTGAFIGPAPWQSVFPVTFTEYALFGDLTVHVTDKLDVQFGGRESSQRQLVGEDFEGVGYESINFFGPQPNLRADGSAFTYLASPEFKIAPDAMVYARVASGYRIGGVNFNYGFAPFVPQSFGPDKTTNYELGAKADLFDHTLSIDTSVYYISWKDIQVSTVQGGLYYQINGGSAKSEGVELSLQWHPARGTTLSAVGSVANAELTQSLPPNGGYGLAGDRLPFSARASGSLTADQDIFRIDDATGFVGATVTYLGSRLDAFTGSAANPRLVFPSYSTINVHAGVRYDHWAINWFANNVADKRGIIGGNASVAVQNPGYVATVIQPRIVGLSVSRDF